MASSEVGKKRKRAWRKPREAIGPGVLETSTETKSNIAIAVIQGEGETGSTLPIGEKMDIPATTPQKEVSAADSDGSANDRASGARGESQIGHGEVGEGQKIHEKRGGVVEEPTAAASLTPAPPSSAPVEIDGSVLEGVSFSY